jgi:methionyl aminopeptidase
MNINEFTIETLSEKEIEIIRKAALLVSDVIFTAKKNIKVGISTLDLEEIIFDKIKKLGCEPAFKGYRGYPACSCISIDDELVHGVPKKEKIIKKGQLVSIDVGIKYEGFYADAATTLWINSDSEKKEKILKLLNVAYQAIHAVLPYIKAGSRTSEIGYYIQRFVESNKMSVIREYVGHTIGRNLHEKPDIPNFGEKNGGVRLEANMVICIEPMVSLGDWRTTVSLEDNWTVKMKDGSLCAHFEHMVLVKENSCEILTKDEVIKPFILNL